jgi:antirestriction protein ArdC
LPYPLSSRFGTRSYAAEELVAELGAAFLYAEFFRGYGAVFSLFSLGFPSNWTYK